MNRRHLLKSAGAVAIAGFTAVLPRQTAYAHKKEALREVHLYAGDGYFRWEFKDNENKTVRTDKNAPMKVKVGQLLLLTAHNEGKILHGIHIGRKPNLAEQRYEEAPFEPFHGFTTLEPRGFAEIELLVPDKIGEWELGDFSVDRSGKTLYETTGMKAPFVIEK
jgi:hypothetical protein